MTNRTVPVARVRIEPVTQEVRESFAAYIFSVSYGAAGVPVDAIVVMVPRHQPSSRSVRVFHGTRERSGTEQAQAAVSAFKRDEANDDPPVEVVHSRHSVADLEAGRGLRAQRAMVCYDMGLRDPHAPAGHYCGLEAGHDGPHAYTLTHEARK